MNCHPSECYQTCNFGAVSIQHIFFQPASFSFSTLFFLGGYAIFLASCSLTFTGAYERTLLIFENIGLYLMRTSLSGHAQLPPANLVNLMDGPLEDLWGGGGGGAGEVQKKNSRKGKLNEKNSCTPINSKTYSCYGLKKIYTRNLVTKKNSCGSKIPLPPPHNFSNSPSLM